VKSPPSHTLSKRLAGRIVFANKDEIGGFSKLKKGRSRGVNQVEPVGPRLGQ